MTSCSARCRLVLALTPALGAALAMTALVACATGPSDEGPLDLSGLPASAVHQELRHRRLDLRPLSQEPVPQPINGHIINQAAAIRVGKAFFWDNQAGSDGTMACAVCHSTAGSDARLINMINPGLDGVFASGGVTGPGQTYTPVLIQNDDIVGSQGVALARFVAINPDPLIAKEDCTPFVGGTFGPHRQVEARQSPTIFGAGFMRQLFWGGEASDEFNGVTIWGTGPNGFGINVARVLNAALASQATGPVNNFFEMNCFNRPLIGPRNSFATKMLARPPLQFQRVSPTDSVLGPLANPNGPGLICNGAPCTYPGMLEEAFGPELVANAPNVFSVMWGEAVAAYEATLIPDQTPFDRFLSGRFGALTPRQLVGLVTFVGRGNCATCHTGAMLSDATVSHFQANGALNRDGGDQGFHNIGLVNSVFDRGRADLGPAGVSSSQSGSMFDNFAFKTPTLRNVGLTAPYFHTGSNPRLEDVVEFYNRGGDAANPERSADIFPLHLTAFEKAALVDFMRNALTDCRVVKSRAPFDHPELPIPNGIDLAAVGAEGTGSCGGHGGGDDDDDDDD
jgi:cytochrome c peroxidase